MRCWRNPWSAGDSAHAETLSIETNSFSVRPFTDFLREDTRSWVSNLAGWQSHLSHLIKERKGKNVKKGSILGVMDAFKKSLD